MKIKPKNFTWKREKVNIVDLFLDPQNIRLQIDTESQSALINDLFINEEAFQIVQSIAGHGYFPDETPVVIEEKNKKIVIDGNRRVAALKAMLHPEIVPKKEEKIKDLLKKNDLKIKEIDVLIAPNRNDVQSFLAAKHTQNSKRPWSPLRQAYFYKAELARGKTVEELKSEYPNINIDKFLKRINIHRIAKSLNYDTDQIAAKVHNERKFPASTIERIYEDKQVRKFLGFEFDKNGEVKIHIAKEEFSKGFKRIVQDIVEKNVDSRALNTEKERAIYLKKIPNSEVPKQTYVDSILTSKSFKENPPAVNRKKKKLAPANIQFSLNCNGVRRMLEELQKIDHHSFPNATHDLLRSFLECSLKAYFDHKNIAVPRKNKFVYLDDVLMLFSSEMKAAKNHKLEQVSLRIKSNATMESYSASFLNATNHNPDIFAVPHDVEDAWEMMEPLFRFILDPK